MACCTLKKGLVGAGIAAATLGLVFGADAWNLARMWGTQIQEVARDQIPVETKIAMIRQELNDMETVIRDKQLQVAQLEVEIENLVEDIDREQTQMEQSRRVVLELRDRLKAGERITVSDSPVSFDEARELLEHRFQTYMSQKETVRQLTKTLKVNRQTYEAHRGDLVNTVANRQEAIEMLDQLEATHAQIQATEQSGSYEFDDTGLSRIQAKIEELRNDLEVRSRLAEDPNRYLEFDIDSVDEEATADLLDEIDAELGPEVEETAEAGTSL